LSTLEKLVALSKKDRGEVNEEELGEPANQIIHKQNTPKPGIRLKAAQMDNLNSQSYRSLKKLNPITKESLTMTDRSMDGVSEELRPAAVTTEQLMLQTIILIQIN
jgi:hypothetical protein